MIAQPGLRQPLALFESRPLGSRQSAQPGQVAAARAGLAKLIRVSHVPDSLNHWPRNHAQSTC